MDRGEVAASAIKIEPLLEFEGGEVPIAWFCRGHIPLNAFLVAVKQYLGKDAERTILWGVRHDHWRAVPAGPGIKGCCYHRADGPGQGVFAVTVVERG